MKRAIELTAFAIVLTSLASCDSVRGIETRLPIPAGFQPELAQRVLIVDPRFDEERSDPWDGEKMDLWFGDYFSDRTAWDFLHYDASSTRPPTLLTGMMNRLPTPLQVDRSLELHGELYERLRSIYVELPPFEELAPIWWGL
ncbi:MAG: hypothetical protein R3F34_15510 [Planctomycetota bacterium]